MSCIAGVVILIAERRKIEITENIQPAVNGYDYHICVHTHIESVICNLFDGGSCEITAAMEPDNDRIFCLFIQRLCPDIEVLAVFILRPVAMRNEQFSVGSVLIHQRTYEAVGCRFFHTFPFGFHRHLEPVGMGIRDTLENILPVVEVAF